MTEGRTYDLANPAQLREFSVWHDSVPREASVMFEDQSMQGRTIRATATGYSVSPELYAMMCGHLELLGVNVKDREIRRGDLN